MCKKRRGGVLGKAAFVGHKSRDEGGDDTEPGGNPDANVVQRHAVGDDGFEDNGGYLHAGVDGGAHGTAEGVPYQVVKPFGEFTPAMFVEVLSGTEIEVRIEFMYNRSKFLNGECSDAIGPITRKTNSIEDDTQPYYFVYHIGGFTTRR